MNIKAAIFDMDGTLVDSLMLWDIIWSDFGKKYLNDSSFKPSTEDDKKMRTMTLADAMELVHKKYGLGNSSSELLDYVNGILIDFYAEKVELKSGVKEFLEYCKAKGVKMCIASATVTELIELAVKHCGLEDMFSEIFSCGSIGKGKEEPDIFLMAQEFMGERSEQTWVFEDSLTAIETASKIGMPTVGVYDRFSYGQEQMRALAIEYIAQDETFLKLIGKF